jgi:hypothetical protein
MGWISALKKGTKGENVNERRLRSCDVYRVKAIPMILFRYKKRRRKRKNKKSGRESTRQTSSSRSSQSSLDSTRTSRRRASSSTMSQDYFCYVSFLFLFFSGFYVENVPGSETSPVLLGLFLRRRRALLVVHLQDILSAEAQKKERETFGTRTGC